MCFNCQKVNITERCVHCLFCILSYLHSLECKSGYYVHCMYQIRWIRSFLFTFYNMCYYQRLLVVLQSNMQRNGKTTEKSLPNKSLLKNQIGQAWSKSTEIKVGRININWFSPEPLSFEKSIHQFWDWLKYAGIHPDLLLMSRKQHCPSNIARGLLSWLILFLIVATNVFEQIRFIIESWNADNLVKATPNLLFTAGTPFALWTKYQLWSQRREIELLFVDWKQVEMQSRCFNLPCMIIEVGRFKYYITYIIFSLTFLTFAWNLMEPERSFFFSHYPVVNETFNPIFVYASTVMIYKYLTLINATTEIIPLLFFYHVACVVGSLVEEWNSHLKSELYLRVVWQRYERILNLVERANRILCNGIALQNIFYAFKMCLCVFYSIVLFRTSTAGFLITSIICLSLFVHIITTNNFLSKLYSSTDNLYKSVVDLLSEKWYLLQD